jgi:hypothetical protein
VTNVERGVLTLMAVVFWTFMVFDDLCYGRGWCRYADDATRATPGAFYGGGAFAFRWGGWE